MNRLVLFDIDGTLVSGKCGHKDAFIHALNEVYGVDVELQWERYRGFTDQMIMEDALAEHDMDRHEINAKLKECIASMDKSFRKSLPKNPIHLLPGAIEGLDALKGKAMLGLVTGNMEPIAKAKMESVGLWDRFSVGGFGSDDIDRANLVRIAMKRAEKLGFHPETKDGKIMNAFLVGDTAYDVKAGKSAGVMTIAVLTGGIPADALKAAGCDYLLTDLTGTKLMEIVL